MSHIIGINLGEQKDDIAAAAYATTGDLTGDDIQVIINDTNVSTASEAVRLLEYVIQRLQDSNYPGA
jgi:hypothetical protein